ncbi:MAG TPA: DUF1992 domain-containing protein [Pyrinomonadaceae bacterium]|jgi:hypothetical protein
MSDEPRGIEELIKQAIARGEFEDLPGKGKPLDLDAHFATPEHLRMGYSMLKGAEFVPEEVELLREMAGLREELKACPEGERRKELGKALQEKSLRYTLLMERAKRSK